MEWLGAASEVLMAIFGLIVVIGGWTFRRELQRNDADHKEIWDRMSLIDRQADTFVTREEFSRLQIAADIRFEKLDQDIKNTGAAVQTVLREELGKVNGRLDAIMLSLNTRKDG